MIGSWYYDEIIKGFERFLDERPDHEDTLGWVFGCPESELPFKKELIKRALESKILDCTISYLETGNRLSDMSAQEMQEMYLKLGEYVPDDDICVKSLNPEMTWTERINMAWDFDKSEEAKAIYNNIEKYESKIIELKLWAELMTDKWRKTDIWLARG